MIYRYNSDYSQVDVYSSIVEASGKTGVPKTTIHDRLTGKHSPKKWTDSIWSRYPLEASSDSKEDMVAKPKVLLFDIETSPMVSYNFNLFKVNIGLKQVIELPFMLTWSAKWLDDDEMIGDKITPEEALARNDERIVVSLWEIMDSADIIVGHYSSKFDEPFANARFVTLGLPPLSPHATVDTKHAASKYFKFYSNKLDGIATVFGVGNKMETDFDLWRGCMEGNQESIDYMFKYNNEDVRILENVYRKLLPYISNHPNVSLFGEHDEVGCTRCGSHNVEEIEGKNYYTSVNKYTLYRCKECGAYSRKRKSNFTRKENKNILTSTR